MLKKQIKTMEAKSSVHVLFLITDTFFKGMGGLSVQVRQTVSTFKQLYPQYFFHIISPDEKYLEGPNYFVVPTCFTMPTLTRYNPHAALLHAGGHYMAAAVTHFAKHNIIPSIIHAFDWPTFTPARLLKQMWNIPLISDVALSITKEFESYCRYIPEIAADIMKNTSHVFQCCSIVESSGLSCSDSVIVHTERYKQILNCPFKVKVVPNGIDIAKIRNRNFPNPFYSTTKKRLMFIGRLTASKNVMSVVKAVENRSDLPIELIIVGHPTNGADPALVEYIKQREKKTNVIRYVGPKYGDEKFGYYKYVDGVIMPSIHEPFGLVSLETLASGTLLMCSMVDGLGEVLDDSCCIPCGTSVENISHALGMWVDVLDGGSGKMNRIIEAGYARADMYSWDNACQKLESIYKDCRENQQ